MWIVWFQIYSVDTWCTYDVKFDNLLCAQRFWDLINGADYERYRVYSARP